MSFQFNKELHRYEHQGIEIPSVTQVLPEQKFYVSHERLEETRQEGEDNHSLMKMFFDTWDAFGFPFLEALEKWIAEKRSVIGELLQSETPLFSAKHKFAGKPDLLFSQANIDLKRIRPDRKLVALQFAGYSILAKENKINNTKLWIAIWYDGNKIHEMNVYNPHAEGMFLSLVKKWYIEQQYKNYLEVA